MFQGLHFSIFVLKSNFTQICSQLVNEPQICHLNNDRVKVYNLKFSYDQCRCQKGVKILHSRLNAGFLLSNLRYHNVNTFCKHDKISKHLGIFVQQYVITSIESNRCHALEICYCMSNDIERGIAIIRHSTEPL